MKSCVLLVFDSSAVVACIRMGGWVGTTAAYRRSAKEVVCDVVFQVLIDITGIQVPFNEGGEFCIHLSGKVL